MEWQLIDALMQPVSSAADLHRVIDQLRPLLNKRAVAPIPKPRLSSAHLETALASLRGALFASRREMPGFNVWTMAGLQRDEVRTTACLAALLNPSLSGPSANVLLKAILEQAEPISPVRMADLDRYVVHREHYFPGDRTTRMDIVAESASMIITIEVKIDAAEGGPKSAIYEVANDQIAEGNNDETRQFARIVSVTKKIATEAGKDWLVLVLSRKAKRSIPEITHVTWGMLRRAIRQALRDRIEYSFHDLLLDEFGRHIQTI